MSGEVEQVVDQRVHLENSDESVFHDLSWENDEFSKVEKGLNEEDKKRHNKLKMAKGLANQRLNNLSIFSLIVL